MFSFCSIKVQDDNVWIIFLYELFPDPTIADAIMDRVIHNAYILALDSKKSMREVMAKNIKTDY